LQLIEKENPELKNRKTRYSGNQFTMLYHREKLISVVEFLKLSKNQIGFVDKDKLLSVFKRDEILKRATNQQDQSNESESVESEDESSDDSVQESQQHSQVDSEYSESSKQSSQDEESEESSQNQDFDFCSSDSEEIENLPEEFQETFERNQVHSSDSEFESFDSLMRDIKAPMVREEQEETSHSIPQKPALPFDNQDFDEYLEFVNQFPIQQANQSAKEQEAILDTVENNLEEDLREARAMIEQLESEKKNLSQEHSKTESFMKRRIELLENESKRLCEEKNQLEENQKNQLEEMEAKITLLEQTKNSLEQQFNEKNESYETLCLAMKNKNEIVQKQEDENVFFRQKFVEITQTMQDLIEERNQLKQRVEELTPLPILSTQPQTDFSPFNDAQFQNQFDGLQIDFTEEEFQSIFNSGVCAV